MVFSQQHGHKLYKDNSKHPLTEISANSLHNDYFRILYTSKGTANRTVHLFDLEEITGEWFNLSLEVCGRK
jgi:hypothetical protein